MSKEIQADELCCLPYVHPPSPSLLKSKIALSLIRIDLFSYLMVRVFRTL